MSDFFNNLYDEVLLGGQQEDEFRVVPESADLNTDSNILIVPKETRRAVFWYPHVNVGNQSDINSEASDESTYTSDLEKFGAFHFRINIYPEYKKIGGENEGMRKINETVSKESEKMLEQMKGVQDTIKGYFTSDLADGAWKTGVEAVETFATLVGQFAVTFFRGIMTGVGLSEGFYDEGKYIGERDDDIAVTSPMHVYKGAKPDEIVHIFLPFKNYTVNRNSGIQEKQDVIGDAGTLMVKTVYNRMINDSTFGIGGELAQTGLNRMGATMRDFVAPRIQNPSLDKFDLQWNFVPRNAVEMAHIYNIIRTFQYLSVPNFSKTDFFYVMPPVMEMEVLTRDFKKGKRRKLRELNKFYITNTVMEFSQTEGGEVLLTPEGYPMFINFKMNLIKADLTTAQELLKNPFM